MYEIHLMTTTYFRRLARPLLFLGASALVSCAGAASRWDGTGDAGFRYRTAEKQTIVGDVPAGSLAERAGLQSNDVVVAVDGADVTNATAAEVLAAVRGPTGSVARLTVSRDGAIVEIEVERTPLKLAESREGAAAEPE